MAGYGASIYGPDPYGIASSPGYVTTNKIEIPNSATYDGSIVVTGELWLNKATVDSTNFMCQYSLLSPAWWFGCKGGLLTFAVWDDTLTVHEYTLPIPDAILNRWVGFSLCIYIDGSDLHISSIIEGISGEWTTDDLGSTNRGTSTESIYSGVSGSIRDIRIYDISAPLVNSPNEADTWADIVHNRSYFDSYKDALVLAFGIPLLGSWNIDDNAATLVDTAAGNNATLSIGSWVNGVNDATITNGDWTLTATPSISSDLKIATGREVLNTRPTNIEVCQSTTDANRLDAYDTNLNILLVEDSALGTVITFEDPFKLCQHNTITIARDLDTYALDGVTPTTTTEGTELTWDMTSAIDLGYTTTSVKTLTNGGVRILFNTEIKEGNGLIDGVEVALIDWLANGIIVWTGDTGARTLVLSGFTDQSGNIIEDQTISVTIPESSRTYEYLGRTINEKIVYKETFEDKISREAQNWVAKEMRKQMNE